MSEHRINLREPGLIATVYEAITGLQARTNPVRDSKDDAYLVSCPGANHADSHPSCYLYARTNGFICWTHPSKPNGGGILAMLDAAGVLDRIQGTNDAHKALLWIEQQLGLERRTLQPQAKPLAGDRYVQLDNRKLRGTYVYRDIDGQAIYQIQKFTGTLEDGTPGKDFRYRRPSGDGRWIYHVGPQCQREKCACQSSPLGNAIVPIVPYNLPRVHAAAQRGGIVVWLEGEKDADTLTDVGITATTNPFGCNAEIDEAWRQYLTGIKQLIFFPDADAAGRSAAHLRAEMLGGAAAHTSVFDPFADRDDGFDVSDYLLPMPRGKRYHAARELLRLAIVRGVA